MGAITSVDRKSPFSYKSRMVIDSVVLWLMGIAHSRYVKPLLLRLFSLGQRLLSGGNSDMEGRFERIFDGGGLVSRVVYGTVFLVEKWTKEVLFGCHNCGQCLLSYTGYTCTMRCPKGLRNGPCGGTSAAGKCEVYPDRWCVWYLIYTRCKRLHRLDTLRMMHPGVDWSLVGTPSWVNLLTGRDKVAEPFGLDKETR